MTGPEHYVAAEMFIALAAEETTRASAVARPIRHAMLLNTANAHASLALAGAVASATISLDSGEQRDAEQWREVLGLFDRADEADDQGADEAATAIITEAIKTGRPVQLVDADVSRMHIKLTVTCDAGHVLGTWMNAIEDKYPFYCEECDDDKRTGAYPWTLTAEIVPEPAKTT